MKTNEGEDAGLDEIEDVMRDVVVVEPSLGEKSNPPETPT
jgi:hypothetical protein